MTKHLLLHPDSPSSGSPGVSVPAANVKDWYAEDIKLLEAI